MPEKSFAWQYRDERILLRSYESRVGFVRDHLGDIVVALFFAVVLSGIGFLVWVGLWASVAIACAIVIVYAAYLLWIWRSTFFSITTCRVIKRVQQNLFLQHRSEMDLNKVEQIRTDKSTVLGHLFCYGDIEIIKGAWIQSNVYFRRLPHHEEVWNYLSRVLDYRNTHGPTHEITPFMIRSERKKRERAVTESDTHSPS